MLQVKDIEVRAGARLLLSPVSFQVIGGDRIGLVGRNGAGKSSLFALLSGVLHEDAGEFQIPPTWRMAQVAQEMPETAESATDFVIAGDTRLMAAQTEVHAAEAAGDGERMGHALAKQRGRLGKRGVDGHACGRDCVEVVECRRQRG